MADIEAHFTEYYIFKTSSTYIYIENDTLELILGSN